MKPASHNNDALKNPYPYLSWLIRYKHNISRFTRELEKFFVPGKTVAERAKNVPEVIVHACLISTVKLEMEQRHEPFYNSRSLKLIV